MKKHIGWTAVAALLACSACAPQSTATTTLVTPASQHVQIKWDEAVAAPTTVPVNNTMLLFMR